MRKCGHTITEFNRTSWRRMAECADRSGYAGLAKIMRECADMDWMHSDDYAMTERVYCGWLALGWPRVVEIMKERLES